MLDRLTCEQTFRRLNDYLDGRLDDRAIKLVEEHLEACVTCAGEYQFEASLIREVREKLQAQDLPAEVRDRISRRLADLMHGE